MHLLYSRRMASFEAAPNDSRYVPLTQQPNASVPASILTIMNRHNIPLIPAEELGHHLGLTVPPENAHLFHNPRVSTVRPAGHGYGTQTQKPEHEPNSVFKRLKIPLEFSFMPVDGSTRPNDLYEILANTEDQEKDAILHLSAGVLNGRAECSNGHAVVFDRVINDDEIQIIDPDPNSPKWRQVDIGLVFDALRRYGSANMGGVWKLDPSNDIV